MKTEAERKAFIKNPENWKFCSQSGNIRTMVLAYKGFDAFRQEELREDGKWHKKCWYRFPPTGQPIKMDQRGFIGYLEHIDRLKPDMEGKTE